MKLFQKLTLSIATLALASTVSTADTLDQIKKKGYVSCGISGGQVGFASPDSSGKWTGIDIDMCRGVASAVFGDDSKLKLIPLTAKERFTALQSGEVDLLSRITTWTQTRDTALGLDFTGVNYYDGQGFLINKDLGVNSVKELDGATICIQAGTTHELNIADYFKANNMTYKGISYDTSAQAIEGFKSGRCDVTSNDSSQLYAFLLNLKDPSKVKVLPELISKEPLGPLVRQGDDKWFNIVRWTHFAMLNAEEIGVNQKNVDSMMKTKNPAIKRLLGITGKAGENLGLDAKWAYSIIKNVGNYGESFDRNLGKDSPLKIDRGLNNLWNKGGLQYGAPIR
ncbi:amino acid ABC transporter substrate-binding protein [Arcobacteraceae bacterium]|nr:amino acid ABC transporter substrate-binding protein [Arcobacteraceae bacterium]